MVPNVTIATLSEPLVTLGHLFFHHFCTIFRIFREVSNLVKALLMSPLKGCPFLSAHTVGDGKMLPTMARSQGGLLTTYKAGQFSQQTAYASSEARSCSGVKTEVVLLVFESF